MMGEHPKPLGVVVGVDGTKCQVGMYNMSNDSEFLWDGELLMGPRVGAFLTILQNDIKIIASVSSEKVMDQQNSVKSKEFDNRYSKNSINRIIELKKQGVIENGHFHLTSRYEPMVGNVVALTTQEELNAIYSVDEGEPTISIGESVREGKRVELPINKFFASHIGIFGNTGSGKSNTLHKLYMELFKSQYRDEIFKKSRFFVIDFNGEYTADDQFGLSSDQRKIYNIETREGREGDKVPISKKFIFDVDILSVLFSARPATQKPFIKRALAEYEKLTNKKSPSVAANSLADYEIQLLRSIIKNCEKLDNGQKLLEDWFFAFKDVCPEYAADIDFSSGVFYKASTVWVKKKEPGAKEFESICVYSNDDKNNPKVDIKDEGDSLLKEFNSKLCQGFEEVAEDDILRFKLFFKFQEVHDVAYGTAMREHIVPLYNRANSHLDSLRQTIKISENPSEEFKSLVIINLSKANQDAKRVIPMLISKMAYQLQKEHALKKYAIGKKASRTTHLMIDEAHNILNPLARNDGDNMQDSRLAVFEEIIKEGRKFGFFLTLASQRPADISPTIISQIHNFFIHRLVNDADLRMLENTMPTLDRNSYSQISSLGQGEAIVTGTAMQVPILLHVDKEEQVARPNSDDVCLTRDIWSGRDDAMVDDETCNDSAEDIAWDFPHDEYSNDQFDGGRGWAASEDW